MGAIGMGVGLGGQTTAGAAPRPAAPPADQPVSGVADEAASYGAQPDVSDDGRWIVYTGLPADGSTRTSTVWLLDGATPGATPVELTVPVDGIRPGDSVNPAISGDGCFVVAVTEMAYDFFRDDDGDRRWDVYRLELPQCLADPSAWSPTSWELVSTADPGAAGDAASALDRASPVDPPAVSATGSVVAYTTQAAKGREPLLGVTVVDLTVPLGQPGRSTPVAGTPRADPDPDAGGHSGQHTGQHEPAMSGDGRFVAFTSDARHDLAGVDPDVDPGVDPDVDPDVEPVWAEAGADGAPAVSQVYLWDRLEADPSRAVTMVSAMSRPAPPTPEALPDGSVPPPPPVEPAVPSVRGGSSPDVSGDGRYVVFASASAGLVDGLEMPACATTCATQVYRFDRTTAVNQLISRQQAGQDGAPGAAADQGGFDPAINSDGSQVAFVTRSTNLFITAAAAGTSSTDGEIVVALPDLGEISRASVLPDGVTPAAGTNSHPVLSATGGVIVFDTLSARDLVGRDAPGRQVVSLRRRPQVAAPDLDVGTVVVTYPGPEWRIGIKNLGPSTWVPAVVTSSNPDFAITGGTCGVGMAVPPGHYCDVLVVLTPSAAGPITGELTVSESGPDPVAVTSRLSGRGGEPVLAPSPAGADFAPTVVGESSPTITFDISNIGFAVGTVAQIRMWGEDPKDFKVTSNGCRGHQMIPGGNCAIEIAFTPTDAGYRTATAIVVGETGEYTGILLDGTGRFEPTAQLAADTVVAGQPVGVAGSGFAPRSDVVVSWADGTGTPLTVRTDQDGAFLAAFETRVTDRAGSRQIMVRGADNAVSLPVRVLRRAGGAPSPAWGG